MLLAFVEKSCQCCHENGGGILQHFKSSGPKYMIRDIEGLSNSQYLKMIKINKFSGI